MSALQPLACDRLAAPTSRHWCSEGIVVPLTKGCVYGNESYPGVTVRRSSSRSCSSRWPPRGLADSPACRPDDPGSPIPGMPAVHADRDLRDQLKSATRSGSEWSMALPFSRASLEAMSRASSRTGASVTTELRPADRFARGRLRGAGRPALLDCAHPRRANQQPGRCHLERSSPGWVANRRERARGISAEASSLVDRSPVKVRLRLACFQGHHVTAPLEHARAGA